MRTYVYDIETTGFKSDIHTLLVVVFGELQPDGKIKKYHVRSILDEGGEEALVKWAREKWCEADVLMGHNAIAFDRNFLNGVLLRYGLPILPKRILIDTFQTVKGRINYSSISLEALGDALGAGAKDKPARKDWREANILTPEAVERLVVRCKEDVKLNGALWPAIREIYHERWGR